LWLFVEATPVVGRLEEKGKKGFVSRLEFWRLTWLRCGVIEAQSLESRPGTMSGTMYPWSWLWSAAFTG